MRHAYAVIIVTSVIILILICNTVFVQSFSNGSSDSTPSFTLFNAFFSCLVAVAMVLYPELVGDGVVKVVANIVLALLCLFDVMALGVYVADDSGVSQCAVACQTAQAAEFFLLVCFGTWTVLAVFTIKNYGYPLQTQELESQPTSRPPKVILVW